MKKCAQFVVFIIAALLMVATIVFCVGSAIDGLSSFTFETVVAAIIKFAVALMSIGVFGWLSNKLGFEYPDELTVDEASCPQ